MKKTLIIVLSLVLLLLVGCTKEESADKVKALEQKIAELEGQLKEVPQADDAKDNKELDELKEANKALKDELISTQKELNDLKKAQGQSADPKPEEPKEQPEAQKPTPAPSEEDKAASLKKAKATFEDYGLTVESFDGNEPFIGAHKEGRDKAIIKAIFGYINETQLDDFFKEDNKEDFVKQIDEKDHQVYVKEDAHICIVISHNKGEVALVKGKDASKVKALAKDLGIDVK